MARRSLTKVFLALPYERKDFKSFTADLEWCLKRLRLLERDQDGKIWPAAAWEWGVRDAGMTIYMSGRNVPYAHLIYCWPFKK